MLEHAMAASFCSCGADVKLLGVVPTPAVSILTPKLDASVGIMITASHNSFRYNGIKLFNKNGLKLFEDQEDDIENINAAPLLRKLEPQDTGRVKYIPESVDLYCDKIVNSFKSFDNCGVKKVVVDCANGSFSGIAPKILKKLGFDVISIHDFPDGVNINENCGAIFPEVIRNAVQEYRADVGISFDGDGDRVVITDRSGNIQDGEQILAVLAKCGASGEAVSTVTSNSALGRYLKSVGVKLTEVDVGDRNILEYMQIKKDIEFGAEASGHVIIRSHALTGDGLFAALKVIEQRGVGIFLFKPNPVISTNVFVKNKSLLNDKAMRNVIRKFEKQLEGRGKLTVRMSGTEPLLRISVDGENKEELQKIMDEILENAGKLL
jgi:phosphoglucosamine mutase